MLFGWWFRLESPKGSCMLTLLIFLWSSIHFRTCNPFLLFFHKGPFHKFHLLFGYGYLYLSESAAGWSHSDDMFLSAQITVSLIVLGNWCLPIDLTVGQVIGWPFPQSLLPPQPPAYIACRQDKSWT